MNTIDQGQQVHPAIDGAITPRKRFLFYCLLGALPLVGLLILEGVLRCAGFGGYAPMFKPAGVTAKGDLIITDTAGAASYFFANPERPGYNEQYCFYQPKDTNTLRIFLVGESAMKGFPEPRNLAASAFFAAMLHDLWPERHFEVINLGTTAIASYPVKDILLQALEFQPDLIIIGTGHNEFFGAYGVASTGSAGSRPWMLSACRWFYSLATIQAGMKLIPHPKSQENKTLMELMLGRNDIPTNSPLRRAAAENLHHNVSAMIESCRARNVPVLVCNQPSNERDLAPIGSAMTQPLLPRDLFKSVTGDALAHYLAAQNYLAMSNYSAATAEYTLARDLDTLPWRAPGLSEVSIVQAARELGAPVCDLELSFRNNSPGGSIGWELMDDHVHPTLKGQALMARTWIHSLTNFSGKFHLDTNRLSRLASDEEYARRLGDNPYDRYAVAHTMRVIFQIPFMRQNNPMAAARFEEICRQIEATNPPEVVQVMREWQTAKPHAGGKRPITGMVARVFMKQGDFARAYELLRIAQTSVPEYTSWHMEYVYFALACQEKLNGKLNEAQRAEALDEIRQGEFLLRNGFSESGMAERHLGRLHQLRGEFAEAIPFLLASRKKLNGMDLVAADEALVLSFLKAGKVADARQLIQNGIEHSGIYADYYRRMSMALPAAN